MIIKKITTNAYVCDKCQKEYVVQKACEKHEKSCNFKSSVEEVFVHDGKYTYPTIYLDSIKFYRMCMVDYIPANHHVWVYYNKQYTIGETDKAISFNNYYAKDSEAHGIMNRLAHKEFFDFCDEKRSSSWKGEEIPINENAIYVDKNSLIYHDIYVTYEKGQKIKVEFGDQDRKYGNGKIPINKNNRITKIEIFDKEILKKELVTTTHTLDIEMKDNLMYMKKHEKLFEFEKCRYGVDEEVVREFLNKTKMKLPESGVITLEGRRVSHNTDDWLDINTKEVKHFQGSSYRGVVYGLRQYHGKTEEEAILSRAFKKADQRVSHAPKGRFKVGDLNVIMPDHHNNDYYDGDLNFFCEDTRKEISHKDMLKILKDHKGVVTVSYHK